MKSFQEYSGNFPTTASRSDKTDDRKQQDPDLMIVQNIVEEIKRNNPNIYVAREDKQSAIIELPLEIKVKAVMTMNADKTMTLNCYYRPSAHRVGSFIVANKRYSNLKTLTDDVINLMRSPENLERELVEKAEIGKRKSKEI